MSDKILKRQLLDTPKFSLIGCDARLQTFSNIVDLDKTAQYLQSDFKSTLPT